MSPSVFARLVEKSKIISIRKSAVCGAFLLAVSFATVTLGQFSPHDPGVRGGTVDAGQPIASLPPNSGSYYDFFADGLARFQEIDGVPNGLGPRFNTNQCSSCHAQPNVGGTSPSTSAFPFLGPNPETQFASPQNALPSFITPDGPVREARFKFALNRDGRHRR